MSDSDEQVLVIPNEPQYHLASPDYFVFTNDISDAWKEEVMENATFVDRWLAEEDPTILQLIPYVVVIKNNKILSYERKGGGEGRLEAMRSIGIGGHVNVEEVSFKVTDGNLAISWNTVLNGAARELEEEIGIPFTTSIKSLKEVGIVYTPSDCGNGKKRVGPRVGEVHLGIVYSIRLKDDKSGKILPKESEGLVNPMFLDGRPANIDAYETWSRMIMPYIDDILHI